MKSIFDKISLFSPVRYFKVHRPTVIFHSDDWGLTGIPNAETYARLEGKGLSLGKHPYDKYSLETREDLEALYNVLLNHHDSQGRSPAFVFNFILANIDFPRVIVDSKISLRPLHEGLPEPWIRPGILETYRRGIELGLVYPALHGVSHFCLAVAKDILDEGSPRQQLLLSLYGEGISQLYSYTPWLGFEFRVEDEQKWLDFNQQSGIISHGIELFKETFGHVPISACAPGYRANDTTFRALFSQGVKIIQEGPGLRTGPYMDNYGLLHLHRNVIFEPALQPNALEAALAQAEIALAHHWPVVVTMHSINFQTAITNYRDQTLSDLGDFLTNLETRHKDLVYLQDGEWWQLIKAHQQGTDTAIDQRVSSYQMVSPILKDAIHRHAQNLRGQKNDHQ